MIEFWSLDPVRQSCQLFVRNLDFEKAYFRKVFSALLETVLLNKAVSQSMRIISTQNCHVSVALRTRFSPHSVLFSTSSICENEEC